MLQSAIYLGNRQIHMQELTLKRKHFTSDSTIGELWLAGKRLCWTLEDTVRAIGAAKVFGKTAIPYGRYELVLTYSNAFKKYLPLLLRVPGYEGVRLHGGNSANDSLGCPLLGMNQDVKGEKIWNCPPAVNAVMAILKKHEKKEKIYLNIVKG